MKVNSLKIKNIRNINSLNLELKNKNLIIGDNAKGKTTIAEIIYYCCFFKSFRTNNIYEIIKFNEDYANFEVIFKDDDQKENNLKINFYKKQKKIFFNNKEVNNLLEVLCKLNVVVISPDNIELINDSPYIRRKYLDLLLTQLDQTYLKKLIKYKKILKIKNNILKNNKIDDIYLSILNEELEELNNYIINKRIEILEKLKEHINYIFKYVTENKEIIDIEYIQKNKNKEKEFIYEEEILYKQSLKGIHLDDYIFKINDNKAKNFASQGQKRLITLSFLLSQNNIISELKNKKPIIIFDDVHLDLDFKRQEKIIDLIEKENQTIYITTNEKNMPFLKKESYNIIKM